MSGLSNHALLMSLNITQWSARKRDKNETSALAAKHGTSESVASVNKSLLPMAHSLDRIHKLTSAIRLEFYQHTLPWGEAQRIIRAEAYLTIAPRFADLKNQWYDIVDQFLLDYPQLQSDAQFFLSTMYDAGDYPSVDELRSKFGIDISFGTIPAPEDCKRVSSIEGFAEDIAKEMALQQSSLERSAMKEAWRRMYDVVSNAHQQLANPKGKIYDSLIENAQTLCGILPSLNIANDPDLEAMRQTIEKSLCQYAANDIRKNVVVREEAATQMADVMSKMGAFYNA